MKSSSDKKIRRKFIAYVKYDGFQMLTDLNSLLFREFEFAYSSD